MATIAQMLPTDIGVFEVLDKKGKAEIFKGIPAMDKHLPKILEKDFTSLSKRLSVGQSKRIAKLVVAQKRARDNFVLLCFSCIGSWMHLEALMIKILLSKPGKGCYI